MSLLLLIDGYNVVAPIAPPSGNSDPRWLQRERMRLLNRLATHLDDHVRSRTCVVFDAANPPPDRPSQFEVDGIDVRFAVGYPEADDLLEELIAAHSAPKQLGVVSSDQRVQVAAKRRGSAAFDSQVWLDDLLEGVVSLAVTRRGGARGQRGAGQGSDQESDEKPAQRVDDDDADQWMREFGY
jgi:predicted RNA-binding protein with PIN domain